MFNFKWMPFLKELQFGKLSYSQKQMVNHFEFHHEINTKDLLLRNLMAYAELNKFNIFDYVPLTFVMDMDSQTYGPDFEKFSICYEAIENAMKTENKDLPNYCSQCLKKVNIKLQQINLSKERRAITHCRPKITDTQFAGKNIWILKPTGYNRGRGVSVFDSLEKLKTLIRVYAEGGPDPFSHDIISNNEVCLKQELNDNLALDVKSRTFVIQKYIERPLLINKRKFDIRAWVLVNQEMKVYFFKEVYIRTSSSIYSIERDAINKLDVHLTNNAIQKYYKEYGQFEDGNQLSFGAFQVNNK